MLKRVVTLLLVWCASSLALASSQAPLRVVVLPKLVVDGKPQDESGLAVAAERQYAQAGMRVVELAASLAAQRAALSDEMYASKVPSELNVLSADAYVALRLSCELTSEGVLGTKIVAYGCALDARVIRVDSGDVVDSHASTFTVHGKTPHLAVRLALERKAPEQLSTRLSTWQGKFEQRTD